MLPSRQDNLLANIEKNKADRAELLKIPEVAKALSNVESLIAEASIKNIVRNIPDDVLNKNVAILTKGIIDDCGIRLTGQDLQESAIRFLTIIKSYYSYLTLSEIKLAFELLHVGKLDAYLPMGKSGPEKSHFQKFNFEFISRVLNAYAKKRNETVIKLHKSLPVKANVTDSETLASRQRFLSKIQSTYEEYRDTEKRPYFANIHNVINEFIDCGVLVGEKVSIAPIEFERKTGFIPTPKDMLKHKKYNNDLHELLIRVYDRFISEEREIKEVLKLSY